MDPTDYDVYEAAANLASDASRVAEEVELLRDHIDTLVNDLTRVEAQLRNARQVVTWREERIAELVLTNEGLADRIAELEGRPITP